MRAIHILTAAILTGGCVFDAALESLRPWIVATAVTGGVLFLADLYASFVVLFEVRGIVVLAKIAALALLVPLWDQRVVLVGGAVLIGVISSHMPGAARHRLLLGEGVLVPDERKG